MREKKIMLLGIWSVVAMVAIVLFIMLILTGGATEGAFTASSSYLQYAPKEMCEINGCDYYGHVSNLPTELGPARVDCMCDGELTTFQLVQSNKGEYFAFNY